MARFVQGGLRLVERAACALADRVITVHDAYRRELFAHGVPSDRIEVVMNAVETEAVSRARAAVSAPADGFIVAYHGTITDWYGVDFLVRAVAQLEGRVPAIRALVLGDGDALSPAEELARQLGIDERVQFSRAYLPHDEVLRAVATATCGIIPNRPTRLNRFALSSKLLEYVALEIPVVVARLETLAAHFSEDEVTFFTPGDPGSLADAIAWVAEHPHEAREKAERARERAEAYSWPANRARLLAALAGVHLRTRRGNPRPWLRRRCCGATRSVAHDDRDERRRHEAAPRFLPRGRSILARAEVPADPGTGTLDRSRERRRFGIVATKTSTLGTIERHRPARALPSKGPLALHAQRDGPAHCTRDSARTDTELRCSNTPCLVDADARPRSP